VIPGAVLNRMTGALVWRSRPAGVHVSTHAGCVTLDLGRGGDEGAEKSLSWTGTWRIALHLAHALRVPQVVILDGEPGELVQTMPEQSSGVIWLTIFNGDHGGTIAVETSEQTPLTDALFDAAVVAGMPDADARREWGDIQSGLQQALEGIQALGLSAGYLPALIESLRHSSPEADDGLGET